jgi:hypothetical protein
MRDRSAPQGLAQATLLAALMCVAASATDSAPTVPDPELASCRRAPGGDAICVAIGRGPNERAAQENAIRRVIMAGCDSAIASSREYAARVAVRDDLVMFSGCFLRNFQELGLQGGGSGPTELRIAATVAQSNLPRRLLGEAPEWFEFDVREHAGRLYSLQLKLENRPRLVGAILDDFPHRAFLVQSGEPRVNYERERTPGGEPWEVREYGLVSVDVSVGWNPGFLDALDDALEIVQDAPSLAQPGEGEKVDPGALLGSLVTLPFVLAGGTVAFTFNLLGALLGVRDVPEAVPSVPQRDPEAMVRVRRTHPFHDRGVNLQMRTRMSKAALPVLRMGIIDETGATLVQECSQMPTHLRDEYHALRPNRKVPMLAITPNETWTGTLTLRLPQRLDGAVRTLVDIVDHGACRRIGEV